MDPASIFGLVSGGVQVVQAITSTVQSLNQLVGKFREAESQDSIPDSGVNLYRHGADEPARGCGVVMDVVSRDVSTLVQSTREDGMNSFWARIRVEWNEETMRGHQEKLHVQVMALQLLFQFCQCHTTSEQMRLLGTATTRRIFHRDADDTATILSTRGSRGTSYAGSISQGSRQSIGQSDFDRAIAESSAYHRVLEHTIRDLDAASLD
ncbi:hypothetical protein N7532_006181 [Penicillium argentinense]|uniref:Uncharacterized protein n=1 Tax=Penicillium argentinense TaxID=1131581 RepID=A0A9W9KAM2_9EURO|nr:uncharacterized protein N7532_006181 [Penicillium argentinense]KAJ5099180.1 hypothetical protein N7532_006181 [Penicillium argentinense]